MTRGTVGPNIVTSNKITFTIIDPDTSIIKTSNCVKQRSNMKAEYVWYLRDLINEN